MFLVATHFNNHGLYCTGTNLAIWLRLFKRIKNKFLSKTTINSDKPFLRSNWGIYCSTRRSTPRAFTPGSTRHTAAGSQVKMPILCEIVTGKQLLHADTTQEAAGRILSICPTIILRADIILHILNIADCFCYQYVNMAAHSSVTYRTDPSAFWRDFRVRKWI